MLEEPRDRDLAAQRSGTVVRPASRAATAGNSAERSEVIVKMIEIRSSDVRSLRAMTSREELGRALEDRLAACPRGPRSPRAPP